MRQKRSIARKSIVGSTLTKYCILILLISGTLGVGYAAHTDILESVFYLSTNSMDYIFDDSTDITIQMQDGTGGSFPLGGTVSYDDKKVIIEGIGPIRTEDLNAGSTVIIISYAIKPKDMKKGFLRPAEETDLGTVTLKRLSDTPDWSLESGANRWGLSDGVNPPAAIYNILPDDLAIFHAYNKLIPRPENGVVEEGIMEGTLTLELESGPILPDSMEIGLKSLDLDDEIVNEIKKGSAESTLQIEGAYEFIIPLNLDQFNVER